MNKKLVVSILTLVGALSVNADNFTAAKSAVKPTADGIIQQGEYRYAATFEGAGNYRSRNGVKVKADENPTACAVTWTDDSLYIAVRTKTGEDGFLPKGGPRDRPWMTDSIEIWINPPESMRKSDAVKFGAFQLIAYWDGKLTLNHHSPGFGLPMRAWKAEGLKVAHSIHGDYWDCEIAIPASAFVSESYQEGDEWGFVLGHNYCRKATCAQLTYLPFKEFGAYTDTKCYSTITLKSNVEPTHFNGKAELLNKTIVPTVPGNITARVRFHGKMEPKKWRRVFAVSDIGGKGYFGLQEVTNPDGSSKMVMFYHANARKQFLNFIDKRLPSPDEDSVMTINILEDSLRYYLDGAFIGEIKPDIPLKTGDFGPLRALGGEAGVELKSLVMKDHALTDEEIMLASQGDKGLSGELKWYPSILSMACDIRFPKPEAKAGMPRLTITDKKGKVLVEQQVPAKRESCVIVGGKRKMMVVHEVVKIAEHLADGEYHAILQVNGKTEIDKTFYHKNYEWFNTSVAREEIILPGFTAPKTVGDAVEIVGRKYVFAESGLPKEIWTLGEQILAGEIKLVGRETGGCGKLSPDGEVAGSIATGKVEQDGFYDFILSIPAGKGAAALEIPVKAEYAKLFHASGAGMRTNPAGFLDKKIGKVFGSSIIPHSQAATFIPYVFVGTDDRGICYAADTDQGWEHDKELDAVEIFRKEDGSAVIRLNLVNGEGEHKAKKIRLSLMATPAKPMPQGWRGWVDAYDVKAKRNTCCNCSNPTWGCYLVGMARYPTFMDWEYVIKMREAADTGKVDNAWVEKWIERSWKARKEHPELVPWLAKKTDDVSAMKSLHDHAYAGLRRLAFLAKHDTPDKVVYYYTCDSDPCDGLYELKELADEWGKATSVYGSHQDYAIYYLKEMCKHGMTGVYNDNTFFVNNYDWVTGGAWIDEKGEVHPSYQLYANRTFARRQIQAMLEAGIKKPWLTVHHTNANIIPTFSYATNTMGMEWKYGADDYQVRYTRDYIRTVNQGYQGGFFATSLEGIFGISDPKEKTRVTRTMLAALLPHEVQPTLQMSGDHALVKKALTIKQEFGVGEQDCEYRAYYDEENWFEQPRADVMISVYRRGGEYLAIIGSYAEEDVELKLQLKRGKLNEVVDPLDGASLKVETGVVKLPLKRHDCAILRLK